jgi:hypothetical protein
MLATQTRVLRRNAGAGRAVAACAGGDLAISHATAVDALAQGDQFLVFGKTGLDLFVRDPVGDVFHVVVGQRRSKALHDGVFALAGLELLQLLDQVFRVLLCQLWILGEPEFPSTPWQATHTAAKLAPPLTRSGLATLAGAAAAGSDAAPCAGAASPAANDMAGTANRAARREVTNSFISGVLIGWRTKLITF